MHAFKREHFERDHPGERFADVNLLSSTRDEAVRKAIRDRVAAGVSDLVAYRAVIRRLAPFKGTSLTADSEFPAWVWSRLSIEPPKLVLLAFDAFSEINEMRREDLEKYFQGIWYPISDDLLVFDESASWFVLIDHDGCVGGARLPT